MSDLFESYERQWIKLSAKLSKICTNAKGLQGEQTEQKLSEIKTVIHEAELVIRIMELEARSLQPDVKAVLLAKLMEYKSDLNNLKSQVKRLLSGNFSPSALDELMNSRRADTLTADQRARLMRLPEILDKASDKS